MAEEVYLFHTRIALSRHVRRARAEQRRLRRHRDNAQRTLTEHKGREAAKKAA